MKKLVAPRKFILHWNPISSPRKFFDIWWSEIKHGSWWNGIEIDASRFVCHIRLGALTINFMPPGDFWYQSPGSTNTRVE